MGRTMQDRGWMSWTSRRPATPVLMFMVGLVLALVATQSAQAHTFTVLHAFTGADGADLATTLIRDAGGNFYGTTFTGGASNNGTVFKLDTRRKLTVLHSFGGASGSLPNAELVLDKNGNLYGTTEQGGAHGNGMIFKLDPTGTMTVLHSFCSLTNCNDGGTPRSGLIRDSHGNLYGTNIEGSRHRGGAVYRLDSTGKFTVLHSFGGGKDGLWPFAALIQDLAGDVYGTTGLGGRSGDGVVFKVNPAGKETLLHAFDGLDGANPFAGLLRDAAGNVYGTTLSGGVTGCGPDGNGCGTVFKVSKTGKETVLYRFTGGSDGFLPYAGLVRDAHGNLYGAAEYGGDLNCATGGGFGCGTIYKLDTSGKLTVLHTFTGEADGKLPYNRLLLDAHGNLYGTATGGGNGTIFKITP